MNRIVLTWLAIGLIAFLILPWYVIEDGFWGLEWIVDDLLGIGGGRQLGFGPNKIRSLPDAVAQTFIEFINSTGIEIKIKQSYDMCPECGNASLVYEEGCKKCTICGYSEC